MIIINNEQDTHTIDTSDLEKKAQLILDDLGYGDYDLGILLTDNPTIHRYNKEYRDKDKPTDILSFPYHELEAGERIEVEDEEDKNLGDIIISPVYVESMLPDLDTTLDKRLDVLLVHGICHLLGYDHIEDADYEVMKKEEARLLNLIGY